MKNTKHIRRFLTLAVVFGLATAAMADMAHGGRFRPTIENPIKSTSHNIRTHLKF